MGASTCAGCNAAKGQKHKWGCDNEACPFCGEQLAFCSCCDDLTHLVLHCVARGVEDRFTNAEKERWAALMADIGSDWKQVLDSSFDALDLMDGTPPDWCESDEDLESFKRIKAIFDEADVSIDYKWEQFCEEKGRLPFPVWPGGA